MLTTLKFPLVKLLPVNPCLQGGQSVCYSIIMKKLLIFIFLCSGALQAQPLQDSILQLTANAPVLQGAWWAAKAQYPGKDVLFSVNETQRMAPASTLKLITSAAVLDTFGPDYQFETRLYADALPDADGVLNGNIYIRGGGDPSLGSTRPQGGEDALKVMKRWVKEIQKFGIKTINGHIYADETLFEGLSIPPKVNWENMGNYYAAPVSALSLADNAFKIRFSPQPGHGKEAKVSKTEPEIPGLNIRSFVTANAKDRRDNAYVYGAPGQFDLEIYGTIPTNLLGFTIQAALPDPSLFTAQYLQKTLEEEGIKVTQPAQKISTSPDYNTMHLLYTQKSAKLKDILYVLNKRSFNFYAEMLVRHLALNAGEKATLQNGIKQLELWLKKHNIPLSDVKIYDASGLSRDNMLTVRALTDTLNAMLNSPYFDVYYQTLATPNDRGDLLLLRRWLSPQKRINDVHVKGGTIDGVKAMAGYVKDQDGQIISFALIANNLQDKNEAINRIHEDIIKKLLHTSP